MIDMTIQIPASGSQDLEMKDGQNAEMKVEEAAVPMAIHQERSGAPG